MLQFIFLVVGGPFVIFLGVSQYAARVRRKDDADARKSWSDYRGRLADVIFRNGVGMFRNG